MNKRICLVLLIDAASGLPNPTLVEGEVRFYQAQDQQDRSTPYNLVVSFLLTAGHDTDGCRINTISQLDEGKKMICFEHLE